MGNLRADIKELYEGQSFRASLFRYGLLGFDVLTIAYFLLSTSVPESGWMLALDYMIAAVLVADFVMRMMIAGKVWRHLVNPITLTDIIVIATLLAPAVLENMAFLRVMRTLRLLRSYHVLKELREGSPFFKRNEELLQSIFNLVVFIFFVTALVYVFQVRINPQINSYVDALYFTVTTLTTTGFGDITLQGSGGRLMAVVIMVFGISLFLRLVQTIFRPQKVEYTCPSCGLTRHEPDAVHCKHCGRILHIESEGD